MRITFGKHYGKLVELLVLKVPDYVMWLLAQDGATGDFREVQQAARQMIRIFNEKPILKPCLGAGCENPATRGSVSRGSARPNWWCDDCDPYQLGASPGKLLMVTSYGEAINYVYTYCKGEKPALRTLIRQLAQAKGLPERVGEAQARAFFG